MKYLTILILFLSYLMYPKNIKTEKCIGVGPGGFSGFWYTYSKLKDLNYNGSFYCASSGCISLILKDVNFIKVYNSALNIKQSNKKLAYISKDFIDFSLENIDYVPDVNIFTMNEYGTCLITKPNSKQHLKSLLITTTNIPFIFGNHLRYYDGGLCYYWYNPCIYSINLPLTFKFISNVLNYNMKLKDVLFFYTYSN